MINGEDVNAMVRRLATTDDPTSESIWTFGFGSNMNVALLRSKKGLNVLESAPGVVKGWKMAFRLKGLPLVEPSFADAQRGAAAAGGATGKDMGGEGDEVHGVAVRLPLADYAALAKQESGYGDAEVTVAAYDGRALAARIFTAPPGRLHPAEVPCSARYLAVLVAGARAAGLRADYVAALAARPTYAPDPETLVRRRAALPQPEALPAVGVEDLWAGHSAAAAAAGTGEANKARVACLGYVFELPAGAVWFASHKGRDITARASRQWRGLPLDAEDDLGRPPFPVVSAMDPGEREFVYHWVDHYLGKEGCAVVGFLKEYKAQADAEAKGAAAAELRAAWVCR